MLDEQSLDLLHVAEHSLGDLCVVALLGESTDERGLVIDPDLPSFDQAVRFVELRARFPEPVLFFQEQGAKLLPLHGVGLPLQQLHEMIEVLQVYELLHGAPLGATATQGRPQS